MTRSESIAKIAAALAAAQGEMTAIVKDKTAKVQTKAGGAYSFDYADLGSVLDAVKPALNKHGIALLQPGRVEGDKVITETVLAHASGEWIASEFAVKPDDLSPQKVGSALTYGRRYALSAMIGVFSEEDDDGNAASGNDRQVQQRKAPATAPRALVVPGTVPVPHPVTVEDNTARKAAAIVAQIEESAVIESQPTGEPVTPIQEFTLALSMVEDRAGLNRCLAAIRRLPEDVQLEAKRLYSDRAKELR